MTVTFDVSDVATSDQRLATQPLETTLTAFLPGMHLEQWALSSPAALVQSDALHPLVAAAWAAFDQHFPLTLGPDAVWFSIAQGFARHIALHAEELRARFVRHEGTTELVVSRPDFVLGQQNPWPEVFGAFSDQIATHTGKLRDLFVADFSTTGPVERAASEVLLMDAMQHYFTYTCFIGCGIPRITLRGTPEDWRSVRRRAAMLSEFGLEWWTEELLPVLDQFVAAAEGRADRSFWQSMVRYRSGSMGSELTGWIHVFLPYLFDGAHRFVRNEFVPGWRARYETALAREPFARLPGPSLEQVPHAYASAPVLLMDLARNRREPIRFVSGLFGVAQDAATGALEPVFGWAVARPDPSGELRRASGRSTAASAEVLAEVERDVTARPNSGSLERALRAHATHGRAGLERMRVHAREVFARDYVYADGGALDAHEAMVPCWLDPDFREEIAARLAQRCDVANTRASPAVAFAVMTLGALPAGVETEIEGAWWCAKRRLPDDFAPPAAADVPRLQRAVGWALPRVDRELAAGGPDALAEWIRVGLFESLLATGDRENLARLSDAALGTFHVDAALEAFRAQARLGDAGEVWQRAVATVTGNRDRTVEFPPGVVMAAGHEWRGPDAAFVLAEIALMRGDVDGAADVLERALGDTASRPRGPWLQVLRALARAGKSSVVERVAQWLASACGYIAPLEEIRASLGVTEPPTQ